MVDLGWSAARVSLVHRGWAADSRVLDSLGVRAIHAAIVESMGVDLEVADYLLMDLGLSVPGDRRARTRGHGEDRRRQPPMDVGPGPVGAMGVAGGGRIAAELIRGHFERVMEETRASVAYAEHRFMGLAVGGVVMVGGGAEIPGVVEMMRAELGVPVSPWSVGLAGVDEAREAGDPAVGPRLAVATGLCLRDGGVV